MLLAIPGLILVCVNLIWLTTVIAILSTRYRDIQPIIGTTVQLLMFATPDHVAGQLARQRQIVAQINPVYHLIEITRTPMLGEFAGLALVAHRVRPGRGRLGARRWL